MNVVVCVKQIPDPAAPASLDPRPTTLVRDGKLILDESDSYGVEMGLQLAEQAGGGEVTLVSMAPAGETSGLRTALAMGAAKAILVSDDVLGRLGRSVDGQGAGKGDPAGHSPTLCSLPPSRPTGTPGPCRCSWPSCSGCPPSLSPRRCRSADRRSVSSARPRAGYDEVECPLPAVVTVTAGVVEPRYPSFKGIMAAKSKPLEQLTVAGSRARGRTRWAPPVLRQAGHRGRPRQRIAHGGRESGRRGDGYEHIVRFIEQLKLS